MQNTTTRATRQVAAALAAGALALSALTACGRDQAGAIESPASAAGTAPTTVTETVTPSRTADPATMPTLDPHTTAPTAPPTDGEEPDASDPAGTPTLDPNTTAPTASPSAEPWPGTTLPPDFTVDPDVTTPIPPTTPADDTEQPVCGTTEYVDDAYHFMTSGHDFVQLCSDTTGENGAILSFVFEGEEKDTVAVEFDFAADYGITCGFSDRKPICLVHAADSSGKSFHGQLYSVSVQGLLITVGPPLASTTEFALTPVSMPTPSSDEGLLLVEGLKFNLDTESSATAPVGYRTSTVRPEEVVVTGCTKAYQNGYPKLPTKPVTGPCDGTVEVVDN